MAARCVTEAFSTTCAVHTEDCEGWWLSGCHNSVAKHWQLKPGCPGSYSFHLLLFSPQNIILLIPTWGKLSSKHRYYNLILIPRPSHCPDCELWSEVDSGKVETRALIGANKDLVWGPVQGVQGVCPGGSETVVFLSTIQQGPKVMHKHCNKACSDEQYKVRGTVLHYRVNLVPRPRPPVRWLYYRKAGES